MNTVQELQTRSESKCELCGATEDLAVYEVTPKSDAAYICAVCTDQIDNSDNMDSNHWRCLNDSMWSTVPAVQVLAWRMLNRLKDQGWPQDLLDMLYLEDEVLSWAKEGQQESSDEIQAKHKDSNGVELTAGDAVVLIKDLNVKGANFTAKRGTAVRNISLVFDNPEHIEGKVSGQQIVILTKFVKKS